jgi:hypothetical protein
MQTAFEKEEFYLNIRYEHDNGEYVDFGLLVTVVRNNIDFIKFKEDLMEQLPVLEHENLMAYWIGEFYRSV